MGGPTPVLDATPALHAALVADGWEGTVAKRTTGRYRCGKRSDAWVKLKSPAARDRDRRRFVSSIPPSRSSRIGGGRLSDHETAAKETRPVWWPDALARDWERRICTAESEPLGTPMCLPLVPKALSKTMSLGGPWRRERRHVGSGGRLQLRIALSASVAVRQPRCLRRIECAYAANVMARGQH